MMKPMTTTPTPLVTREALFAFTQRLVERYALEEVILFGSLDLLVLRPEEVEVRYRGAIRSCAGRLTMERGSMDEPWWAVPEWMPRRKAIGKPKEHLSWRPSFLGRMRRLVIFLQNHLIPSS